MLKVLALLAALLCASSVALAQNDTAIFQASSSLQDATREALNAANQAIAQGLQSGNSSAVGLWFANDSQAIVQNVTLSSPQQILQFWQLLVGSSSSQNQSAGQQNQTGSGSQGNTTQVSLTAGTFRVISRTWVSEFGASYSTPNGSGLIMRLWRFQAVSTQQQNETSQNQNQTQSGGSQNQTSSGGQPFSGLPVDAQGVEDVRRAGVFRIYREAITGPVSSDQQQLSSLLEQINSQFGQQSQGSSPSSSPQSSPQGSPSGQRR